jgi:methionine sulfoxide reductase heme-binding subunit
MNRVLSSKWSKVVVFLLGLTPLAALVWFAYQRDLSANPIEYVTHYTGDWTLRFLLITLSVTPLRMLFKRPAITRFRRMLGLFAFFYACLHLTIWWFDRQFSLANAVEDVLMRVYITVGMAGYLAILPLAVTSTAGWVRRLTFKRWQRLHRLIYFSAAAGVVHYYWLVKSDVRLPLMYGTILVALLLLRLPGWIRRPGRSAPRPESRTVETTKSGI